MGDQQLQAIRVQAPELILLDVEDAPHLALKFAQFLIDQNPALAFIAVGPTLTSDQLLTAMRAGVAEYLPKPVDPDDLRGAACGRPRSSERPQESTSGRRAGSSRSSARRAAEGPPPSPPIWPSWSTARRRRTLLVDLDLEMGESALVLGIQPRFNFVDFVENFRRMDAGLLASYIERHESGVHLLSARSSPRRPRRSRRTQIRRILSFLRQHYDYIIVDTPRSFAPPIAGGVRAGRPGVHREQR